MTIEQFEKAEKIVSELRECKRRVSKLDETLKAIDADDDKCVDAAPLVYDCDDERIGSIELDGDITKAIIETLLNGERKKLETLEDMLGAL